MDVVAVDWSGRKFGSARHLWWARVHDGELVELANGRSREQIVDDLVLLAENDSSELVVGLDFAFSFPAWFFAALGLSSVAQLWRVVEAEGERWLADCDSPFWGRAGRNRPVLVSHFRQTELDVPSVAGIRPKSIFQIGGAGAVGTGSLRGMPHLLRLAASGYSIWPFSSPTSRLLLEIYPRVLTDQVVKSDRAARSEYLLLREWITDDRMRVLATSSEDAFDAAVSSIVMAQHLVEFAALSRTKDPVTALEGAIWMPHSMVKKHTD